MKLSEYAAQHANDGKKIEAKTYVAASTMIGETFEVKEFARIEKTIVVVVVQNRVGTKLEQMIIDHDIDGKPRHLLTIDHHIRIKLYLLLGHHLVVDRESESILNRKRLVGGEVGKLDFIITNCNILIISR